MAAKPESVAAADVAAGPSVIEIGCSSGGEARARTAGYYSPTGFTPGSSQNHNNASELFLRDLEIEKIRIRELLLVESAVPMLRPTNGDGKCVTLSVGAEHENMENGEFTEVAETDGFHAEKASTDEEQTNNTSPKIAVTNLSNNLKQNADELQEEAREENGWSLLMNRQKKMGIHHLTW